MRIITDTEQQRDSSGPSSLLGIFNASASSAMRAVERAATEVAPTDLPVFIVGESGTGKGTLATMIHRLSRRSQEELVKVNCQNLPVTIPAAPKAEQSQLGLNEPQLRGTVLLDEVLELQPALQIHVMNILPKGDLERQEIRCVPRIIAATRNLDDRPPSNSHFSWELYYRLRGLLLRIPPLRERREDIPLLAEFLLNKHASSFGRSAVRLSWRAEKCFQNHSWPGNVRELENAVKTLLAVGDEELVLDAMGFSHGPAATANGKHIDGAPFVPSASLKEASRFASRSAEKQLISEVLQRTNWNRKKAAKELNISYKALLYKLKQNGIHDHCSAEDEQVIRRTTK